jgi:hypothetical protein
MNKTLQYISLGMGAILLVGIGFIVDRVGGFEIRTDDVSSSISLVFSQPLLRGVPLTIRWEGQQEENIPVTMRLVSTGTTVSFGSGKLFAGSMRITVPCTLPSDTGRLELLDASNQALLASSSVDILSAGPDCVQ